MVSKEIYKLIQFRDRESKMAYNKKYESRLDKAREQANKKTVEVKEVVNHVNEFLEKVGVPIVNNPKFSYNGYIDYSKIMEDYSLNNIKHLVWIKFTIDGYVGVVAASNDVNFSMENTSGRLINDIGKDWNKSFVLIFPLSNISDGLRKDIECGIGNYLIQKEVPLLDFYSHRFQ